MATRLVYTFPDDVLDDIEVEEVTTVLLQALKGLIKNIESFTRAKSSTNLPEEAAQQLNSYATTADKLIACLSSVDRLGTLEDDEDSPVRVVFNGGDTRFLVKPGLLDKQAAVELANTILKKAEGVPDRSAVIKLSVTKEE